MEDLYGFRMDNKSRTRNAFIINAPYLYKQMIKKARDKAKLLLRTNEYIDMIEAGKPQ